MARFLTTCGLLSALMLLAGSTIRPVEALPADAYAALQTGCGLCWKDDDCGSEHKCCRSNCKKDGEKKCEKVKTCPK